jgi:hypothetical protein
MRESCEATSCIHKEPQIEESQRRFWENAPLFIAILTNQEIKSSGFLTPLGVACL